MRHVTTTAIAIAFATVAPAACTDFNSPSELGDVQILAVRATPKAVPAGSRAELDFLVGGPDGLIEVLDPQWVITEGLGTEIVGRMVSDGDAFFYEAPAEITEPSGVTLTLFVEVDGVMLNAVKAVGIGLPEQPNPTVELAVAGQLVENDGDMVSISGPELDVSASVDPDPGEMGQIAWYSTFGEADPIRGTNVTIEIDEERGTREGPLVVVARDGLGGVAWKIANLIR